VQPFAQLVGLIVSLHTTLTRNHHAGGRDTGDTGKADDLPPRSHQSRRLTWVLRWEFVRHTPIPRSATNCLQARPLTVSEGGCIVASFA
jgi:hypothetical protein